MYKKVKMIIITVLILVFISCDNKKDKTVFDGKKLTETITSDNLLTMENNIIEDNIPDLLAQGRGLAAPPSRSSMSSNNSNAPALPPPPSGTGGSFLTYQTR